MKRSRMKRGNQMPIETTCLVCKKSFMPSRYQVRAGGGKYCSQSCAGTGRRSKVERTCKVCKVEFTVNPSQFKYYKGAGQYCSKPCANQGRIDATALKPIPDKYGRSNRHADKIWQQAVRERDASTCQRCGKYDPFIHAHHVAPRARRPDLRHEVSNGKCLCGSCHQWVHWNPIDSTAAGLLSDATYERAKKEAQFCSVCGDRHRGLGLCIKHYKRFRKYGDPLLTKPHGGGSRELLRVAADASMREHSDY